MAKKAVEQPEDAWRRITDRLAECADPDLWQQLESMAAYRGGDSEQNLTLAALVHTIAGRDERAHEAFESWKKGPDDGGDSGHIVDWMLRARDQEDRS